MKLKAFAYLAGGLLLVWTNSALAWIGPFTENFNSGVANWRQNTSATPVILNGSGGPDTSAYVSSDFAFMNATNPQVALFRGHDNFDASGDAFVGDWQAAKIILLSADVRHNAPIALDFFVRLAKSANSPAVSFTLSQPVQPGPAWTHLDFNISFSNPLHTNEGPPTQAFYDDVLKHIGNVQFGAIVPNLLSTDPIITTTYRYDLDNVTAVPEPTSVLLAIVGLAAGTLMRRRNR